MKSTIGQINVETQDVIDYLSKCKVGDIITYQELNRIALGDTQAEKRHVIQTARKRLLADYEMVFDVIMKVGLKRLSDQEIVETSASGFSRIRRIAKKRSCQLTVVNYDELSTEKQIEHNTNLAAYGAVSFMTQSKQIKKIKGKIENHNEKLQIGETLRLFQEVD